MTEEMKIRLVADAAGFGKEVKTASRDIERFVSQAKSGIGKGVSQGATQATAAVNKLGLSIRDLQEENKKLAALARTTYDPVALRNYTRAIAENQSEIRKLSNAYTQLQASAKRGATAIRGGTSAAMSFGHIIQDMPYGINGVANNITQLTTQLGYMSRSAKAAGVSMRAALLSSISNPATIAVLAVSAITTALTIYQARASKAKKETDDLGKSFKTLGQIMDEQKVSAQTQISRLDTLVKAAQNVKIAMTDRIAAMKELQSKYPSYFGNLSQEDILAGKVSGAYQRLSASILAAAEARAYEKAIEEEANKRLETRQRLIQNLIQQAETRREIAQLSVSGGTLLATGSAQQRAGELAVAEARLRDLQNAQKNLSTELRNSYGTAAKYAREIQKRFEDTEGSLKELIGDGAGKAAEAVKRTMTEVKTDLSTIGSPIADGLLSAVKKFDKAFSDSIARAAQQLSGDDFVDALNRAQRGDLPQLQVQPDLRGPKGRVGFVDAGMLAAEQARIEEFASGISQTFGDMYASLLIDGENAFDNINRMFDRMIKRMISDLVASGLTKAFTSLLGGAVGGGTGFLGGLFKGIFGVPKLASGGILSGPSLVMAGEYPGAKSNPEVIAPLSDLKKYGVGNGGDINVNINGKVQGNELVLLVERVVRDYTRRN